MSFLTLAKTLRNSLRQRRIDLGLSQSDVDAAMGVATGLVAKWEGGFRSPTGFNLYCWAKALDCDVVLVPRPEKPNDNRSNRSRPKRRPR
jgi:transcriptional regulator with XRE-family HTH domain